MGRHIDGREPGAFTFSIDKKMHRRFISLCIKLRKAPNLEMENFMRDFVIQNEEKPRRRG
jgi:hypothetical protein